MDADDVERERGLVADVAAHWGALLQAHGTMAAEDEAALATGSLTCRGEAFVRHRLERKRLIARGVELLQAYDAWLEA